MPSQSDLPRLLRHPHPVASFRVVSVLARFRGPAGRAVPAPRPSSDSPHQVPDADQIVDRRGEGEHPSDSAQRLSDVCRGLAEMARSLPVVFPVHPRTRATLQRVGIALDKSPGLTLSSRSDIWPWSCLKQTPGLS